MTNKIFIYFFELHNPLITPENACFIPTIEYVFIKKINDPTYTIYNFLFYYFIINCNYKEPGFLKSIIFRLTRK